MGQALLATDRCDSNAKSFSGFLNAHPGKEAHLNDFRFALIELCEFIQGVVQSDKDVWALFACVQGLVDLKMNRTGTAANPILPSRVIHQNETHEVGGDPEEMGAAFKILAFLLSQLGVGLVQKCSWLKCVARALSSQRTSSQTPEFFVNDRC